MSSTKSSLSAATTPVTSAAFDLPINALLPTIEATLASHSRCILQAEPGAGKSTQVPLALMSADWLNGRKILLLEPRRLAVRSLANYLAHQLGEPVGQRIGYQVRNDRNTSANTLVEVITEGILIRRLQQDPELSDTALIIFDEFHERALDTDLALTLCLDSQQALRDDLKLLVMSATIDSETLSGFLDNAPVIQCPGRAFPVSTHFLPQPIPSNTSYDFYSVLTQTLVKALQNNSGDCLVFLPGQKEIFNAIKLATERLNSQEYALIPLYGGLSPDAQNSALKADSQGRRKIIFATNIAETSLTIEGIHIVIDSGLVRRAAYDSSSGMTRMLTQTISQASATQRAGRAGRLAAGHAYRLWTESEHHQRAEFETVSMLNSDLTDLCLEIAMWGVTSLNDLPWLTPPPAAHYQIANALLVQLGLLNTKGHITPLGEQAIQLGLSARLAKMLLVAASRADHNNQQLMTACDIAAILSERDLLKNSHSVNLEDRIRALQAYRLHPKQALKDDALIVPAVKEALKNSQKWQKRLKTTAFSAQANPPGLLTCGQLLALAYPDRIAQQRSQQDSRYQLSNGKGTLLAENDPLGKQPWLVVANLDGQRRDGKVFMAAAITLEEINALFAEQITQQTEVRFNPKKQTIEGIQSSQLGALTLNAQPVKKLDPEQVQSCIINTLKATQLKALPWNKQTIAWLTRVRWLATHPVDNKTDNPADYQDFSAQALLETFDDWCLPYLSHLRQWSDLAKLDWLSLLQAKLSYAQLQAIEQHAPTHYTAPSGKKVAIDYPDKIAGQPPKVAIQLQELFGELSSPKLANGQVALTFELLSPAQRPIQITSDLAHFWTHSYIELAKEMRGKYPKHRWPEKPLEEKAGRSLQKHRQRNPD